MPSRAIAVARGGHPLLPTAARLLPLHPRLLLDALLRAPIGRPQVVGHDAGGERARAIGGDRQLAAQIEDPTVQRRERGRQRAHVGSARPAGRLEAADPPALRPDDVPMQRVFHPQQAIVQPLHVQEAAVHQVARRLPNLPLDSPAALVQPFDFPMSSNGLSTSAHSTAKSIPKANATPLRPNENVVHPLLRHTKPPPAGSLPPRGAIASQLGHEVDYQLSYGIEQSLVRSSTNYGLEDSYYEDGLNGNATHFDQRKVMNPYNNQEDSSGISSFASSDPSNSGPTHRAQFTFVPRHDDEVLLEIGDALKVEREYEDHWCFGTNLRTGQQGLFPAAHVCEIDLVEEITSSVLPGNVKPQHAERDTFYLTLLASIEVAHHKGNDVLVQAINKVCEMYQSKEEILVPQTVLMEVSFRGVHIIDKRKKDIFRCPTFDYFYSLQNLSFCGSHPKQLRYFGFITKHPLLPRRAFKRSYDEYTAFIHPTEDIFIDGRRANSMTRGLRQMLVECQLNNPVGPGK
ncbi:JNK-interacting protein 1 [Aphelenchoides fujianensis]|nr:JNK-interacting protein 1 [Aphelenchoides fujianensis]